MTEFYPYFTSDGSVGLYNSDFDDIYHSATGALTESYEKFIYPIDFNKLLAADKINVLDICYGIGYNTKSFLNFILKNFQKNSPCRQYIAPIDTDNIIYSKHKSCNAPIYTDNIFNKISITAVDNDINLNFLSPFIKTGKRKFNNKNLGFNYKSIEKFIDAQNNLRPRIDNLINYFLLIKAVENTPEMLNNEALLSILDNKKYQNFYEADIKGLFKSLVLGRGYSPTYTNILSNLHNIYYMHLSKRYKNGLKRSYLAETDFTFKNMDARAFIKNCKSEYNLIFLDAFSPNKCPCLWSYEFFIELYKHLSSDGMLLTYSTSASVRNAMLKAGFYVGKVYNMRLNKFTGTIGVKNSTLIKFPLSEFDLGLLNTRAGIFYRDANLNGQNEAIIEQRNSEIKKSDKMSSSQYIKLYKY